MDGNYADLLVVGIPCGLNGIEERTQSSLWANMASPLLLGGDVFDMPQYAKEIIINREVIETNQDPLGIKGYLVKEYDSGRLRCGISHQKMASNL